MKRLYFILLFCFSVFNLSAQNFIINPGFETITNCADNLDQLNLAPPWQSPSNGTPDLFNSCDTNGIIDVPDNFMGNLYALEGQNYAGIHFVYEYNYREYLKTRLKSCLKKGKTYELSFYVSLSESRNAPISTEFFGAYIGTEDLYFNQTSVLDIIQPNVVFNDTFDLNIPNQWRKITANYTATGNEQMLIIGNFHPNSSIPITTIKKGTYLFIDNLSLINPDPHVTLQNCRNKLCRGDSLYVEINGIDNNPATIPDSIFWVSPQADTTFFVEINDQVIDTISIEVVPNPKEYVSVEISCQENPQKALIDGLGKFNLIRWSNGSVNTLISEIGHGNGWVFIEDNNFCADTLDFNSDSCSYFVCKGDYFNYLSEFEFIDAYWIRASDGNIVSRSYALSVQPEQSETYVLIHDGNRLDSVNIIVRFPENFEIKVECRPNEQYVEIIDPHGNPLWSDGKKDRYWNEFHAGNHWVQLTDNFGCVRKKDFKIPFNICDEYLICPGDSIELFNPVDDNGYWINSQSGESHFSENSLLIQPKEEGVFYFQKDIEILDSIRVKVSNDYNFRFEKICIGDETHFKILNPLNKIIWDNGVEGKTIQARSEDNLWVKSINSDGCEFIFHLTEERQCNELINIHDLLIPNVITPNGDGKNDFFDIQGEKTEMSINIFDRWGQRVFSESPYNYGWDAYGLPSGTYFYHLIGKELEEPIKGWIRVSR